jgi:hypothetical protein
MRDVAAFFKIGGSSIASDISKSIPSSHFVSEASKDPLIRDISFTVELRHVLAIHFHVAIRTSDERLSSSAAADAESSAMRLDR